MSFQIFLSYARADNVVPVGSGAQYGFVTLLRANLAAALQRRAVSDVAIWRDKEGIADGEQFTPKILKAIEDSQLLLVVLTPASLKSAYCQQELEAFTKRWSDGADPKHRIIVVLRTWVEPARWPAVAGGQNGYRFYTAENERDGMAETPMYGNDGKPTSAFYDVVDRMAQFIERRIGELGTGDPTAVEARSAEAPPAIVERRIGELGAKSAEPPAAIVTAPNGRTIFVAQPAADMEDAYRTVVAELRSDGYTVVPDPDGKIPDSVAAPEYVDAALAQAELSIHLLGERAGARDKSPPIVGLQLERAALRDFRRVIFAPKVFADPDEPARVLDDRDPIAVRDRFGRGLDSDTVIGDGLGDFVVELKNYLRKEAPKRAAAESAPLRAGARVFVDFHPSDVDFAASLRGALRERGLHCTFAAVEDDKTQNKLTNSEPLRAADGVIYCWANATDAWLYAEAAELEDWGRLGRAAPFAMRAAVVGPPERGSKRLYSADDPPDNVDLFVDLSSDPQPRSQGLEPLVAKLSPQSHP
jgi:hypothetical protein